VTGGRQEPAAVTAATAAKAGHQLPASRGLFVFLFPFRSSLHALNPPAALLLGGGGGWETGNQNPRALLLASALRSF
jgi:hypothetical protein